MLLAVLGFILAVLPFAVFVVRDCNSKEGTAAERGDSKGKKPRVIRAVELILVVCGILFFFLGLFLEMKTETTAARHADEKLQQATSAIAEDVKEIATAQAVLEAQVAILQSSFGVVHKFSSYDEFVACITKVAAQTKNVLWVTRWQNGQSSGAKEELYFREFSKRVRDGLDVRRIVICPNAASFNVNRSLLAALHDQDSLQIAQWRGDAPPVNFELILGDEMAVIGYGSGLGNGAPSHGFVIYGREAAAHLKSTYESWWSNAEILKPHIRLDDAGLSDVLYHLTARLSAKEKTSIIAAPQPKAHDEQPRSTSEAGSHDLSGESVAPRVESAPPTNGDTDGHSKSK